MAAFSLPFDRPRTAILVWAGDEPAVPMYGGEPIAVPPRDVVAVGGIDLPNTPEGRRQAQGNIYRYSSALDRQGKPIPGTVMLRDVLVTDPISGRINKAFDVEMWAKGLGDVNKKLFERGLSIVMEPEDVPAAMEAGRLRWRKAKLQEWDTEIRTEMARREHYRTRGQTAPPLDEKGERSLQNAILNLKLEKERSGSAISDADLSIALGAPPVKRAEVQPLALEPEPQPEPEDTDPLGDAVLELYRLAKANKVALLKEELDGLLGRDPAAMRAVEEKLTDAGVEV